MDGWFNHITNSTLLQHLTALGVNLDPFFKLLWRHVFAVTVIQNRLDVTDEQSQRGLRAKLMNLFESRATKSAKQIDADRRTRALDYLNKWGDRFFEDVEHRTKEVIQRFENEVKKHAGLSLSAGGTSGAPLGAVGGSASLTAGAAKSTSGKAMTEEHSEIVARAQTVISSIQVQALGGLIELVDEIIDDEQ
jgi:hypothetical protein